MDNKKHLQIEGFSTSNSYTTPIEGRGPKFLLQERDRVTHGNFLLHKINEIKHEFEIEEIETSSLITDDAIYLEFESEWGYPLMFDSFDSSGFQILNIKEEKRKVNDVPESKYSLVVVIKEGDISKFIKKIEDYLSGNFIKTDKISKEKVDTGNPLNQKLIGNIDVIRKATLQAFWVDGQFYDFPNEHFITGTGRELSERNVLAIIPKNGWYKNLKRQNKYNEVVRYSLIVSIETEETEVDLYTPVFNILNPLIV